MPETNKTFTVGDPRTFDGDPFDVAERACAQAAAIARILALCVESAGTMARNAEMSRQIEASGESRPQDWEDSAQSRKFSKLHKQAKEVEAGMEQLSAAAGFNPKKPLPKES